MYRILIDRILKTLCGYMRLGSKRLSLTAQARAYRQGLFKPAL